MCRCGVYKFNLGTGTGATVLEVIRAFSSVVGKEIPHVLAGRRKGDVDSLYASCDLAEKVTSHQSPLMTVQLSTPAAVQELGWKSRRSLTDMCRDMWNWQTKNPRGFAG